MWSFVEVARIEQHWERWCALVTLIKAGVPESFFVKFDAEPTPEQAQAAGVDLALRKNLDDAPAAPARTVTRGEFVARSTLPEIGAIYQAAAGNALLRACAAARRPGVARDVDGRVRRGLRARRAAPRGREGRRD